MRDVPPIVFSPSESARLRELVRNPSVRTGYLAPILVSKQEAARLLRICLRTLDYYIARKEMPLRKLGKRSLIPRAALEQFARKDHGSRPSGANNLEK